MFPCVITVTTADPPLEDLEWAREHDIPLLKGTLPGLRALAVAARPRRRVPPRPRRRAGARRSRAAGALAELDSAAIAADYGVPYVRAERCADPDEAAAAAERIGYPVVVKIDNVAHKARVGGVALNLTDAAAVREAAERMGGARDRGRAGRRRRRGAGRRGARRRLRRRPSSSASAAAWPRRSTWSPPAWRRSTTTGAARAGREPAGARPAAGRRPAADGLIDAVVAVSRLAAEHPEIAEIDVNPLLVSPERAVALDCLIVTEGKESCMSDAVLVRDSAARPRGSPSTGPRS